MNFNLHIGWSFSWLVSVLIARKLCLSYRQSREENIKHFLETFVSLSGFFLFVSLPGFATKQSSLVQISYTFAWFFLLLTPSFFTKIVFNMWNLQGVKRLCLPIGLFTTLLFLALNILYFSPAQVQVSTDYWYWSEGTADWLQIFGGSLVALVILFSAVFFLIKGFSSLDKTIRIRSLLIGLGWTNLFLGTISAYVLFSLSSTLVIASGLFAPLGMVLIYTGTRYKTKEG